MTCGTDIDITREEALADYQLPEEQQSSKMYCYCRSLFWEELSNKNNPSSALKEPFEDGEDHCWDWFKSYSLSKGLLYFVPFCILIVNWISKTFLRIITQFYGYQSKPEEVYASAVNMFGLAFINTGLVI